MNSHVYPQNQEIQETPYLEEASKVTGEVGKSRGFRKVSVPSFEQCLLRFPQTTGCGRGRNFPGRDCPKGELGSTFSGWHLHRGTGHCLLGWARSARRRPAPGSPLLPDPGGREEGVVQADPPARSPSLQPAGTRSLGVRRPPPQVARKKLRHHPLASADPDGAPRRELRKQAPRARPSRRPRRGAPPPGTDPFGPRPSPHDVRGSCGGRTGG